MYIDSIEEGTSYAGVGRCGDFNVTSVNIKVAEAFFKDKENSGKEPLMLEILIHEGALGIYIGTNTAYRANENEFLLGRGLKYKVLERCGSTLKLEVLR